MTKKIARSMTIAAPVESVFATVAHIERFSEAVPHITDIEFLSETRAGVGARFRETREVRGRTGSTVLEVTDYVENERVRIVSDAGGTVWDTIFTTRPTDEGTELGMVMEARPHKLLARVSTPMIMSMVARGIEADLEAVKEYCET